MGIPRKKSRPLMVEGNAYRWMRKGRSDLRGDAPAAHSVTVQHEAGGPVLQFELVAQGPNLYDPTHGMRDLSAAQRGLTPALVARVVEAALADGWQPQGPPGAPHRYLGPLDLGAHWKLHTGP